MKNDFQTMKEIQKKDAKKDIIIRSIENFIETKNRYIQAILLLIAVISGIAYGFVPLEMQTVIRYTLVINIFMELYVLQTKDSIMQNKMNLLAVDVNAQKGGLRFEEEIDIDNFFENASADFFLSGIAPSRFIQKYQSRIEDLLKNNKKVKVHILFSSLDTVSENCAEYYGAKDNITNQYDLLCKLNVVISLIENSKILKGAFDEERLLLATSNIVFTTSFVAYNIFSGKTHHSKIKITFYQQGEHKPGELPCAVVDSIKNIRDMYPYFQNIVNNQWNAAERIGDEELKTFSNDLIHQLSLLKEEKI